MSNVTIQSSPFAPAAARSATPSFVPKLRPSASPPQHDSISPFSSYVVYRCQASLHFRFPATLSRAGSASARLAAASPVQNVGQLDWFLLIQYSTDGGTVTSLGREDVFSRKCHPTR